MNLLQQCSLSNNQSFISRAESAGVHAAGAAMTETVIDQQTITMGAVTAGTFTLTFLGQATAAIQWNASASSVQAALNALTTIGAGGVECTGGPLPGTGVVVNFIGAAVQGAQTPMTHTDTLTGGTATITHTTVGTWVANHTKRAALGSKVLANPTQYSTLFAKGIADNATVQGDFDPVQLNPRNTVITAATQANPSVITSAGHGLASTNSVVISGALGNTAINGTWAVTVIDANTFSVPVLGNGALSGSPIWTMSETQIQNDMQFQMNSIFNNYS